MLVAVTTLLACQLAGEVLVRLVGLPIPGPVVGMLLLLLILGIRGGPPDNVRSTAQTLLKHLSLLFVPAGVGVMVHFHRIGAEWLPILVALVGSTFISLAVTALSMKLVQRLLRRRGNGHA